MCYQEVQIQRVLPTNYYLSNLLFFGFAGRSKIAKPLKVKGIENLRVADASIMPTIIGGNTNAPAMMIGARCADFILGKQLTHKRQEEQANTTAIA